MMRSLTARKEDLAPVRSSFCKRLEGEGIDGVFFSTGGFYKGEVGTQMHKEGATKLSILEITDVEQIVKDRCCMKYSNVDKQYRT